MTDPSTRVREMYLAFARNDLAAILDRLDPAVTWTCSTEAPDIPWRGTYSGVPGVAAFFATLAGSLDFEAFEPRAIHAAGATIVGLGHTRARVKRTGTTFESDWAHVFGFAQDKLVHFREFYDTAAIVAAFTARA